MARRDRLQFFAYYPEDFDESAHVLEMNLAEVGLYQLALNESWKRGSIPDDPDRLALLIRRPSKDVRAAWPVVRACFINNGEPGRLVNERLEEERSKAISKSAQASGAAATRHANATTTAHADASSNATADGHAIQNQSKNKSTDSPPTPSLTPAWDAFREAYPKTVPNTLPAIRLFESRVNTPERLAALHKNLPLWCRTRQFVDGFAPDWRKFLESEVWIQPPKPTEMQARNNPKSQPMTSASFQKESSYQYDTSEVDAVERFAKANGMPIATTTDLLQAADAMHAKGKQ
jgi:uncharacterized protein YdaU (DUF1376 family)